MISSSESKIHIFLGGSVGVGKTTTIDNTFSPLFFDHDSTVLVIQEYIDYYPEEGQKELQKYLTNKINAVDFQKYILECYVKQINTPRYESARIIVWERHPYEQLMFLEKDFDAGRCTNKEFHAFLYDMIGTCQRYEIPPLNQSLKFKAMNTEKISAEIIGSIIENLSLNQLLCSKPRSFYFFLYCGSLELQQQRIIHRGRQSECEHYQNIENLKEINERYVQFLFKYFPQRKLNKWGIKLN